MRRWGRSLYLTFLRQLSPVHKRQHPRAWPRFPAMINMSAARHARIATLKSRISSTKIPTTRASSRRRSFRNAPAVRAVTGREGSILRPGMGKSIIAFPSIPKEQVLDTCLKCHSQTLSRANIRRSSHTANGIVCTNCHSIHSSPAPKNLLAKTQTNLCYGCHTNVRAQFSLPFKHRVNEGFMNCTDCHNPHGAFQPTWAYATRPRNVEHSKANEESCINCHADKRGPFRF